VQAVHWELPAVVQVGAVAQFAIAVQVGQESTVPSAR
jgi:hypothetical protein